MSPVGAHLPGAAARDVAAVRDADDRLTAAMPAPFALPVGPLAPLIAGAVRGLRATDWWVPGLRERVGAVLREVPLERLVDGFAGARSYKVAPPTPAPALRALHAVGLALAEPEAAVLVHLGVGSLADGALAEALNVAALRRARVIFLVALLPLEGAPVPPQSATPPAALAAALASAYGVAAVEVDGHDAAAVADAVRKAREADGPTVVCARLSPS